MIALWSLVLGTLVAPSAQASDDPARFFDYDAKVPLDFQVSLLQKSFRREQLERYIEVLAPINPDRLVGRAAPGSIFFQFATHDRFISKKAAEDYLKAAGDSHQARWYFTSHEFNDLESPKDRLEFLKKRIPLAQ